MTPVRSLPRHNKGFTIVEIIVVVVVIAILAAITVVSYRNMQQRANNTKTIANIQQYVKAINTYKVFTGSYPKVPGEAPGTVTLTCLGLGYPSGQCGVISGSQVTESSVFMADLQQKSGVNLSAIVNNRSGAVGGESFTGAVYGIDLSATSPSGYGRVIDWIMEGPNQKCGLEGSWAYSSKNGNTACEISIEDV